MKTKTKATKKLLGKKLPTHSCLCGCGTKCYGRFAPGHDARLVGMIKRGEIKSPLSGEVAAFAKTHGIKWGESRKTPKPNKKVAA